MTRCPASSLAPISPSVLASQATTRTGSPSAAAPAPVSTRSPCRVSTIPISRGSMPSSGTTRLEIATAPLEARSATVSASLIRQSANRESTISTAAVIPAIARRASSTLTPGPASGEPSTKAISASIFGWMNADTGTESPSA